MNHGQRLALTVFAGSVLAVVLFWALLPAEFQLNESADYRDHYEPVARNILAGRGIVTAEGRPATRTPPGFPLILAGVFGLSEALHLPAQLGLSASSLLFTGLAAVFIFLIARGLWGPLPGMLAAALWITYPLVLWLTKQPNSEMPFMAVLYAGFWLLWTEARRQTPRPIIFVLCGLLCGAVMLIRPIAIGLGLVMCLILWLVRPEMPRRARAGLMALILAGNAVALLPWEVWVYSRTGRVIPLSTIGAESLLAGLTFAVYPRPFPHIVAVPADVRALMVDILDREHRNPTFRGAAAALMDETRARPAAVAKLLLLKAARSWYGTDSERFEHLTLMLQVPYAGMILWSTLAAWSSGAGGRIFALSLWLLVLYFWAMALLGVSLVRYMVPVLALNVVAFPSLIPRSRALRAMAAEID